MASRALALPLVVIVGPTASGKTSLSIDLATRFNGEIISADSRAIYKGLDIGTAKPTIKERKTVAHWGIDLINPNEPYSVSDFKAYATKKIEEIRSREHVPFLVGGTGLYIDSILFDYHFGEKVNKKLRTELQQKSIEELQNYCNEHALEFPENSRNKRHLIRTIERKGTVGTRSETPIKDSIIVGITTDRDRLRDKIALRIDQIINEGVFDEAKKASDKYGWDNEAMKSNIYPHIHDYLEGKLTLSSLKEKASARDWQLAKRQLTWLKRNPYIKWLTLDEAKNYIIEQLAITREA